MIVITGGAGFIGSAIAAELNRRGQSDILIVDILGEDERWKNLVGLRYTDYVEADDFYEMIGEGNADWKVSAVFHMGACSDTTESNCSYLVKNNYDCSKLVASWAAEKGAKFIYASSAATYGDGSGGFDDDEGNLDSLRPMNMYGYSKQMFDLWMRKAGLLESAAGLKYFNVFGPNEYHKGKMMSFVVKAWRQIRENGKCGLFKSYHPDYADGEQRRDFLYVKDAVEMTLFFYDNPELSGLYNIGSGRASTWNELVGAVFAAMNREANIEYIDMPAELQGKYQYFTEANMSKLQSAGYEGKGTPLDEAVYDYVRNYLEQDGYLGG